LVVPRELGISYLELLGVAFIIVSFVSLIGFVRDVRSIPPPRECQWMNLLVQGMVGAWTLIAFCLAVEVLFVGSVFTMKGLIGASNWLLGALAH
jgi:hypothetical protein